ncbi:MAG: hypothetical protein IOD15_00130 [Phycisphaerales bacterium]|nr:hypothetical protein [Phycisphaerales bacterium]
MVAMANSAGRVTVGSVQAEATWRTASLVCIERRLQMVQERMAGGTLSDEAVELARAALGVLLDRLDEPGMQRTLPQAKGLGKD